MNGTRSAGWLLAAGLFAGHAGAAYALDVDRIETRSRLGEPLRAEIPVSADADELQTLQAQLATPVTFARIGLPRPQGVVADLRFAVIRDARGGAVIRVTSAQPVEEDFLTFLIQLDWGGERLVREYSLALAAADSLPAPLAPPVRSATTAAPDWIVRAPESAATQAAGEVDAIPLAGRGEDAGAIASTPAPAALIPVAPVPLASTPAIPLPRAAAPEPAPKAQAVAELAARPTLAAGPTAIKRVVPEHLKPAPAATSAPTSPIAGGSIPVRSGDTLTGIASVLDRDGHTLEQMMLALLRANPEAFTRGNINLLRRGAVLRMPSADVLSRHDAAQAAAVVAEQIRQWRDGDMPAMHPAARSDEQSRQAAATAPAEATRVATPRLEIAPPPAEAVATAFGVARSGIAAASDGHELRPETPADAARQVAPVVQIEEMQARIAELEALQRDQQQLIALQNSALAARSGGLSWVWIAAALAAVFALGWMLARWRAARRSRRAASVPAHVQDAAAARRTSASSSDGADPQQERLPTWHSGHGGNPEPT